MVNDPLEVAARAHRDALAREAEAKRLLSDAKARRIEAADQVEAARGPLAAAIVEAARGGRPQVEIVAISGYNREHVRRICRAAGIEPPESQQLRGRRKPEQNPVVAAIVTSDLGVLVARRNDGKPPWTFIAGEVEPGESSTDAAVREVKEETGLEVRAEAEIGSRVHPKTSRTMIYLACRPVGKLAPIVGDEEELAEVKWASLEEARELLPDIFEPVAAHLEQALGG